MMFERVDCADRYVDTRGFRASIEPVVIDIYYRALTFCFFPRSFSSRARDKTRCYRTVIYESGGFG